MQFELLRKDIQYDLNVIHLEPPKQVPMAGMGLRYSHKVIFQDKFGKQFKGDYVTITPMQDDFAVGSPTTFRVMAYDGPHPPIIMPVMSNPGNPEKKLIPSESGAINGTSYSHALQVSKDLTVAQMPWLIANAQELIEKHGEDFMLDFMLTRADKIDEWILHKQEQRATDEIGM